MPHTEAAKALSQLILTVFRLNSELIAAGDRMTKDLRLTSARWQIFGKIAEGNESLTVSQIARNMGLQRQTVQPQVDALIVEGLLELAENPRHRRSNFVHMTAAGRDAYRAASRRQVRWSNQLVRDLAPRTITQADATLRRLLERLQSEASHR